MAARGQQSPVAHPSLSLSLCLRLRCGLVSVTVVTGPSAAWCSPGLVMAAPGRHNPLELLFTSLLVMPLLVMLSVLHNICCVMLLHNRDGGKMYYGQRP